MTDQNGCHRCDLSVSFVFRNVGTLVFLLIIYISLFFTWPCFLFPPEGFLLSVMLEAVHNDVDSGPMMGNTITGTTAEPRPIRRGDEYKTQHGVCAVWQACGPIQKERILTLFPSARFLQFFKRQSYVSIDTDATSIAWGWAHDDIIRYCCADRLPCSSCCESQGKRKLTFLLAFFVRGSFFRRPDSEPLPKANLRCRLDLPGKHIAPAAIAKKHDL
jgi:hypothetical protein